MIHPYEQTSDRPDGVSVCFVELGQITRVTRLLPWKSVRAHARTGCGDVGAGGSAAASGAAGSDAGGIAGGIASGTTSGTGASAIGSAIGAWSGTAHATGNAIRSVVGAGLIGASWRLSWVDDF